MRTPYIVITSENWSRDSFVLFNDENIVGDGFPEEWINDSISAIEDEAREINEEIDVDRQEIVDDMTDRFIRENSEIDEFWTEHMVCRSGDDYWKYYETGEVIYLGEFDSIDEAIE